MAAPDAMDRRLAAILFSDIKGYSRQMDADEAGMLARLEVHDALFRDHIARQGGRVIKTVGDAFMVEFGSAVAAVKCGLEVQRALAQHNEAHADEQPILVRIGIHVGDVVVRDDDLFGETVNVAARLEPLAAPGGLCISQPVYDQVRRKVHAAGECLGPQELKNIAEPVVLYTIAPAAEHLDIHAHDEGPVADDEAPPERGNPLWSVVFAAAVVAAGIAAFAALNSGPPHRSPPIPGGDAAGAAETAGDASRGGESADAPRRGGVLRVALEVQASRFDLFSRVTSLSRSAMSSVVESGVSIDAHGDMSAGALGRWTLSADARRLDIWLRRDVWLHPHPCLAGGERRLLTAQDLVYSLHQALRDDSSVPVEGLEAYQQAAAQTISGITVPEEGHVAVLMTRPAAFSAASLTNVPLIPDALAACEDLRDLRQPVGTGPFRFAKPPTGTSYHLERAADYWRRDTAGQALPYLDAVEFHSTDDPVAAVSLLARGELDAVILSPVSAKAVVDGVDGDTPRLKERFAATGLQVAATYIRNQSALAGLVFFLKQPRPQTARPVRAALARALDRGAISATLDGIVQPSARLIEARFAGHDPGLRGPERDLDAAKRLLEEAGHPGGAGLPELRVAVFESTAKAGEAVRSQLAALGVKVRLATVNEAAFDAAIESGELDAALINLFGRTTGTEPYPFLPFVVHLLGDNGYTDPALAAQLDELSTKARPKDRSVIYAQMERRLLEELPIIPLGFQDRHRPGQIFLLRPNVRGVIDAATGRVRHTDGPMAAYTWLAAD